MQTEAKIPHGSSCHVLTQHAFWLCRACPSARLNMLITTRSTGRTCRVVSRRDEPSGTWAILHQVQVAGDD